MLTQPAACSPMATEPARVYLGHALTDAPREFIDHVALIRE